MVDFFRSKLNSTRMGGYFAKDRQNISTTQFFSFFLTLFLLTNKNIILMSLILAFYLKC